MENKSNFQKKKRNVKKGKGVYYLDDIQHRFMLKNVQ